jgi:hypothetical protein
LASSAARSAARVWASSAQVHLISLHQRRADAPDHAADHLRARGLGVENAAGREHAEHAPHANLTRILMHADFDEMRAEGIMQSALEAHAA